MIQRVCRFEVEPKLSQRLFGVFDGEPVAGESAYDAPDETTEQALKSLDLGCSDAMESWFVWLLSMDSVKDELVQVNIEVQRAAEP